MIWLKRFSIFYMMTKNRHLSSDEEEEEIRLFCERFSQGLGRLKTNRTRNPCFKLYKDKSKKITWEQCWEAISKEIIQMCKAKVKY